MAKPPVQVVSKHTKGGVTKGKTYEVFRESFKPDGKYYHMVGDEGSNVIHHSKGFIDLGAEVSERKL